MSSVLNKLSAARKEYSSLNNSVHKQFVVPNFINDVDLRKIDHSVALIGSRGSGKTTYISYFCHSTRFDKRRKDVALDELDCIVLYWKPDITYCQGMTTNWMGEHSSIRFFSAHASLSLIKELYEAIKNIAYHFEFMEKALLPNSSFMKAICKVTKADIKNGDGIENWLIETDYDISSRINSLDTQEMVALDPKSTLEFLIQSLKIDIKEVNKSIFKVFVDEFENLPTPQQKVINTYRKHSSKLYNWNVAYKSNASPSAETAGDEWLQQPDDYREFSLDEYLADNYHVHAAEILLLSLQNAGLSCKKREFLPEWLGNRDSVYERQEDEHRESVLLFARRILPQKTVKEISTDALEKKSIYNKIQSTLLTHKAFSKTDVNSIMESPSLAMCAYGTRKQKTFNHHTFIEAAKADGDNAIPSSIKEKIKNYEYNTLLSWNQQHTYHELPVYSGFDRFIHMSKSNIRHFNELCYQSIKFADSKNKEEVNEFNSIESFPPLDAESMHKGAINTSRALVSEIINYPPEGRKLSSLVRRIGELFNLSQKSEYQSEPERTIFKISGDYGGQDEDIEKVIAAAESWRVLIVDDSKRSKSDTKEASREFQLNPIYAPYFGISPRSMRSVTFPFEDFKVMLYEDNKAFLTIREKYLVKWDVTESKDQMELI